MAEQSLTLDALRAHVHDLAEKATNSDVEWDVDLSREDAQLVRELGVLVGYVLDPDILAMTLLEDAEEGKRVHKLVGHKHECGARLTGPAVVVEEA